MNLFDRFRLLRFGLVGGAVAVLYVGSFSALVALEIKEFLANIIAVVIAVMFQYFAQTTYTFRSRLLIRGQAKRFLITIGIGLAISTPITTFIGPALEWQEFVSAGVVVVVSSLINYVLFTLWVYDSRGA